MDTCQVASLEFIFGTTAKSNSLRAKIAKTELKRKRKLLKNSYFERLRQTQQHIRRFGKRLSLIF